MSVALLAAQGPGRPSPGAPSAFAGKALVASLAIACGLGIVGVMASGSGLRKNPRDHKLWGDFGENMAVRLAEDPQTPASTLEDLFKHPAERVRRALARNPSTPPQFLSRLIYSGFYADVLLNPIVPLLRLEGSPLVGSIDRALATATEDHEILLLLSSNEDPEIREAVTLNNNTPLKILRRLAEDTDENVRQEALSALRKRGH